eukprot:g4845.t1
MFSDCLRELQVSYEDSNLTSSEEDYDETESFHGDDGGAGASAAPAPPPEIVSSLPLAGRHMLQAGLSDVSSSTVSDTVVEHSGGIAVAGAGSGGEPRIRKDASHHSHTSGLSESSQLIVRRVRRASIDHRSGRVPRPPLPQGASSKAVAQEEQEQEQEQEAKRRLKQVVAVLAQLPAEVQANNCSSEERYLVKNLLLDLAVPDAGDFHAVSGAPKLDRGKAVSLPVRGGTPGTQGPNNSKDAGAGAGAGGIRLEFDALLAAVRRGVRGSVDLLEEVLRAELGGDLEEGRGGSGGRVGEGEVGAHAAAAVAAGGGGGDRGRGSGVRGGYDERTMELRRRVVKETLDTEMDHLYYMIALKTLFVDVLRAGSNDGASKGRRRHIISETELRTIFGGVETIIAVVTRFVTELKGRVAKWSDAQVVGDVWASLAPFFRVYTEYVRNFGASRDLLKRLRKERPRLDALIKQQEKDDKCKATTGGANLNIESFMIKPVARVPRYKLLLQELRKRTPPTHPDRPGIDGAFEKVCEVAEHINRSIAQYQQEQRIHHIGRCLDGRRIPQLIKPGRVLVREGPMAKLTSSGRGKGQFKDYYVWLFSDMLMYGTPKGGYGGGSGVGGGVGVGGAAAAGGAAGSAGTRRRRRRRSLGGFGSWNSDAGGDGGGGGSQAAVQRYNYHKHLLPDDVVVGKALEVMLGGDAGPLCFQVVAKKKTVTFAAQSVADRDAWVQDIQQVAEHIDDNIPWHNIQPESMELTPQEITELIDQGGRAAVEEEQKRRSTRREKLERRSSSEIIRVLDEAAGSSWW